MAFEHDLSRALITAKRRVQAVRGDKLSSLSAPDFYRGFAEATLELEAILLESPNFRLLDHGSINLGAAAHRVSPRQCAFSLLERTFEGHSARSVAGDFGRLLDQNKAVAQTCIALIGVTTSRVIDLGLGVLCVRPLDLPACRLRNLFFELDEKHVLRFGPYVPVSRHSCVLAVTHDMNPCIRQLKPGESISVSPVQVRDDQTRIERLELTKLALTLTAETYVQRFATFSTIKDAGFPAHRFGGSISTRPPEERHIHWKQRPLSWASARKAHRQIAKFADREKLSLAVERLSRSRKGGSIADRALDLGIALEIALMEGKSTSEIRYKMSTRAAWLLGRKRLERQQIFDLVGDVYDLRSSAAHTGRVSPKPNSSAKLAAGQELARKVLLEILQLSRFPDWKKVVLSA